LAAKDVANASTLPMILAPSNLLERRLDVCLGPAGPATVIAKIWFSSAKFVAAIDVNSPAGERKPGNIHCGHEILEEVYGLSCGGRIAPPRVKWLCLAKKI
jgi:hypothetical protein